MTTTVLLEVAGRRVGLTMSDEEAAVGWADPDGDGVTALARGMGLVADPVAVARGVLDAVGVLAFAPLELVDGLDRHRDGDKVRIAVDDALHWAGDVLDAHGVTEDCLEYDAAADVATWLHIYSDDLHVLAVRNRTVAAVDQQAPPDWRDDTYDELMDMVEEVDADEIGAPVSVRCKGSDVTAEAFVDEYGELLGDDDFVLAALWLVSNETGGEVVIDDTQFTVSVGHGDDDDDDDDGLNLPD